MLKVYGKKNGKKELIFFCISHEDLKKTGFKTAQQHGYTITQIIEIASHENGYRDINVTDKYLVKPLEISLMSL